MLGFGHTPAVSAWLSAEVCSILARVAITPRAISGRSSSSSSNGPRRRRSSRLGSIAVADADRGAGREQRELADDPAGAGLDQRQLTDVDPDPALGDDEQPVLDRAAFDDGVAGLERHLLEAPGHRDQRVAGNLAEQRDALEHGDPLDGHELAGRVHDHPRILQVRIPPKVSETLRPRERMLAG